MTQQVERRRENRLRFSWPIWYGFEENGEFTQGQIFDLSRHGVSLTVPNNNIPQVGEHIIARFSYPLSQRPDFTMGNYFQWAQVIRIDTNSGTPKAVLKLNQPLDTQIHQESDMPLSQTA